MREGESEMEERREAGVEGGRVKGDDLFVFWLPPPLYIQHIRLEQARPNLLSFAAAVASVKYKSG